MQKIKNLADTLETALKQSATLAPGGELLKGRVAEAALQPAAELLRILLQHPVLKKHFFVFVAETAVFDKVKFLQFVNHREFLPDSYTVFKNRTGLAIGTDLLSQGGEVVLQWPYKDCVLTGGQSREEQVANERFLNLHLAPEAVDSLLQPKVLCQFLRYRGGHKTVPEKLQKAENMVLKGNNLLALHSLLPVYRQQVKLIYIDPPYNTGKDIFSYNDRFSHATWLTFMKNRLEVALRLLAPDGTIFVQLDHNEAHYCKVLLDELLGRGQLVNEIIWCYTGPGSPGMRQFNRKHDTILWYAKGNSWTFNADEVRIASEVHAGGFKGEMDAAASKGYTNRGKIPEDWWQFAVASRFKVDGRRRTGYNTEKPFKLMERIIAAATDPGDLVLDFFGGSGTTAWVASQLGRRFITIEQMEDTVEVLLQRLRQDADFLYCELKPHPGNFLPDIMRQSTPEELLQLLNKILQSPWLHYRAEAEKLRQALPDPATMPLAEFRRLLLDLVDMNRLYVNLTDLEDHEMAVTEQETAWNQQFYGKQADPG